MNNPQAVLDLIKAQIRLYVNVAEHPARTIQTGHDGHLIPTAVVAMHAPVTGYRLAGRHSQQHIPVTVHCVGGSRVSSLWVVNQVRDALDGWRLNPRAGAVHEDSYTTLEPATNPDTDPQRVETPLHFIIPI